MKTNTVLSALLQLILVALLLAVTTMPATAQGPMPCEICALVANTQAMQSAGANLGYTTWQSPNYLSYLQQYQYQTHWAEVALGADTRQFVTRYYAGWGFAAWPIMPVFAGLTMSAYNYQQYLRQRYAPWGVNAYGNINN